MVSTNGNENRNAAPHDAILWDSIAPSVTQELDTPIDPALVSHRKGRGGKMFAYIEGHTVIDEANRVFGHGGWGYEPVGDVTLREIDGIDPKTGEIRRIHAYSAIVRVTVLGAPSRTDLGFHAVVEDNADGHETAAKGAVTDGLKRAMRSFGARFGNALYADPQPGPNIVEAQHKAAPNGEAEPLRERLLELGRQQGFADGQVEAAARARMGKGIEQLSVAELKALVANAEKKIREAIDTEPPAAA